MKEGRNAMRSNKVNTQINANVVAESLKKEFGLKRSEALNLFAQWSGFQDFGALKASLNQSKEASSFGADGDCVDPEVQAKYAVITFTVRNGEYEDSHSSCFIRGFEGDTRTKKEFLNDIYCYALFFYDDLADYIAEHFAVQAAALEKKGLDEAEIERALKPLVVERALAKIESSEGHYNRGGDLAIKGISVRFISKSDFETYEKAERIRRGF